MHSKKDTKSSKWCKMQANLQDKIDNIDKRLERLCPTSSKTMINHQVSGPSGAFTLLITTINGNVANKQKMFESYNSHTTYNYTCSKALERQTMGRYMYLYQIYIIPFKSIHIKTRSS